MTKGFVTDALGLAWLVATDWVSMSGEFDLLSADIAYLKLHAQNSEPFNLKNLKLEEIGPSDVSGGVTEY